MVATSTGFNPFSNSLDVASWRRSWKCRFWISNLLHSLLKAWERLSGNNENRGVSRIGAMFPEMLICSLRLTTAIEERGMVRGVSVFVRGMRRVWRLKSIWLLLICRISPLRIPVSNASMMLRLNSPFDADNSLFCSSASSRRERAFAVRGTDIAVTGFVLTNIPHSFDAWFIALLNTANSLRNVAGEIVFRRISRY